MTFTFKLSRRLAMAHVALLGLIVTGTSCKAPELVAGFAPPPDSTVVQIVVQPRLDTATIAQAIQLTAEALDASGGPVAAPIDWTSSGGSIDGSGRFVASAPGSYRVRARHHTNSSLADSSLIVVVGNPVTLTGVSVSPTTATLTAGASRQFAVTGQWSNGSTTAPAITWAATGGSISSSGLYTAGGSSGTFLAIATVQGGTLADTATVTVTAAPVTLTGLTLTPSSVTLVTGGGRQFTVNGSWSDGSSSAPAVSWSATGGTISSSGFYTAGSSAGTFRVVAAHVGGTLADTSIVNVNAPVVTLSSLTLSPGSASLLTSGTRQFSASALWSDGSTSLPTLSWASTGGSVSSSGLYTAGTTSGSFRVIASALAGLVADTATVTVTAPAVTLSTLSLAPASVSLTTGATRQFAVTGTWSDGSTISPAVTWAVTGGSMSASGLYTAGSSAGNFRVVATHQGGTLADTSTVTITAPAVTLSSLILTPASTSLNTGGTRQFSVAALWSDGGTSVPALNWTSTGGTVSSDGLYTSGGSAGSFRVIATQQGGTVADTSAVTVTAPVATLSSLSLTPASTSLTTGGTRQFSVAALWSDGGTTVPALTWTSTGGTISGAGLYTAGGSAGSFRVIATQQGGTVADTADVTVSVPAATLSSLSLTPASASLTTGGTRQFAVTALWSDGGTAVPALTWTSTGGIVSGGGLYTAGIIAGTFRVIVTQQGGTVADTSTVTVTAPVATLTSLTLSPGSASLTAGGTRQFSAAALWSDGGTSVPTLTWNSTGGSVSNSGMFSAGSTAGSFRVIASALAGLIADTATVTVTAAGGITPWVEDNFSSYISSSQMLADPLNLYSVEDGYNTDPRITLDPTDGVNGSTKSMKYTLTATSTPCQETTVGRNFKFPGTVTEAWVEVWAKFSANFRTAANAGCASNPDYKFIFGRTVGTPRFDILIGNSSNYLEVSWPNHEEGARMPMAPSYQVFDGQWHRYRLHYKLATSGQTNGGTELWIDGALAYSNLNSDTGAATGIYGLALARNLNQGPAAGVTMSVNWGDVKVFNANPGW